ncbi:MAG: hypothetical protein RL323_839 [Pseudomonadota bacterium]
MPPFYQVLNAWPRNALFVACVCVCAAVTPARAQTPHKQVLQLRLSDSLTEQLPDNAQPPPMFLYGDRLQGQTDVATRVEGRAELRRHDLVLKADTLEHLPDGNTASAQGNVRVNRYGNVYSGPRLQLKLDTFEGHFESPQFSLLANGGQGQASRIDFLSDTRAVAHQAQYSTCPRPPGGSWMPDWLVTATSIDLDSQEDVGIARNGVLRFKGVPLLASPWISFPLSDKRKSGVLPPTLNIDNQSGLEVTLPYYLNLAPNLDATLYPTWMSKRGIDLAGELRYLEPTFSGRVRAAYMASDALRGMDRWGTSWQHQQALGTFQGLGSVGLRLNHNRVSDDDYWRDFPRTSTSLTQRLLANDAVLHWGQGAWSGSLGSHRWQTLQDLNEPILAPYDRVPTLALRYAPNLFNLGSTEGWRASAYTEWTDFRSDRLARVWNGLDADNRTDLNGQRGLAVLQVSKTWGGPAGYVRPALQLHARHYQFEQALGNGLTQTGLALPTASLDGALFLERETRYFGRDFVQTLEPRIFYVSTPYRDQRFLPNYDSASYDFNLATIFTANPYGGHDRIADMNAVTVGATSRLLDPTTGTEVLQLGLAQRFRLKPQRVGLPNEVLTDEALSDVLVSGRLNWSPHWSLNGAVQFDPNERQSVRTTVAGRYTPSNYRVLSAAYRLKRGDIESQQVDLGWQWPLNDLWGPRATDRGAGQGLGTGQWFSVGRVNYSVNDKKIVDLVAGLEYDGGCWVSRIVLERLQRSTTSANQRLLLQLELVGFSRIGSNPLQTLKNNVPRYQYLREEVNPPSRFERYE